jgi:ATP-dependent RNA helicase DeaD
LHTPRREAKETDGSADQNDKSRDERGLKQHRKSHSESGSRFDTQASSKKKSSKKKKRS